MAEKLKNPAALQSIRTSIGSSGSAASEGDELQEEALSDELLRSTFDLVANEQVYAIYDAPHTRACP